ncbi:MAG: DUF4197 domain-containing protein [Rhodospirillales bacterium]|nr:DUF4197 domain-containing protein [Rhodospirillales bacterium]
MKILQKKNNLRFATALIGTLFLSSPSYAEGNLFGTLKGILDTVGQQKNIPSQVSQSLGAEDIIAGLKEALKVGTERVVKQVGAANGYLGDPSIHIPLPPSLQNVQKLLNKFGLGALADDIENKLNKAAEAAAPKTKELFWKAISEMTFDDANQIYNGPQDAATRYFEKIASSDLKQTIQPVVERTLQEVGAVNAYDQLMGQYKSLPFVPDIRNDLTTHATDKALEGLLHYLAVEEAAIRNNPVKRTTEILQKVFTR